MNDGAPPLSEALRWVYDRQGAAFDATRTRALPEAGWLERFSGFLPPGGEIVDLGCGAGDPIARWMLARGYAVTGVDFSRTMLDIARGRFPAADWPRATWMLADMRQLQLGRTVHGIIGWDSFFHLTAAAQRTLLPRLAAHLAPGGVLMLTVGPEAGEALGEVGGETVYHASLAEAEYRAILAAASVTVLDFAREGPASGGRTVLLARHIATKD